jgi:O-methyltransferase involved in polyketide biosynthesis
VTEHTPDPGEAQPKIDTTISHSARIWNYWLGGKDNYPVDREMGEKIVAYIPELVRSARADRRFLSRAVRYLAGEQGIRQFLDIGAGLPTVDNTHEVAQRVAPGCRIVYVDNDPLVLAHARALLTSTPEGTCDYIDSDLREPGTILSRAANTLDFSQPVAVMMLGILNFVVDTGQARTILRHLLGAVPPGSFLSISHPTTEFDAEPAAVALKFWNSSGSAPMCLRSREELLLFFEGTELVEPGVVSCPRWRPDSAEPGQVTDVMHFCGVARKV